MSRSFLLLSLCLIIALGSFAMAQAPSDITQSTPYKTSEQTLRTAVASSDSESSRGPDITQTLIPGAEGPCRDEYPLPYATHWTPHTWDSKSTFPAWQLEQIRKGHHWLLTLWWGDFAPWNASAKAYYLPAIEAAARLNLPIALVSTQWESLLYNRGEWKNLPFQQSPLAFDSKGKRLDMLSPFGAVEPWAEVGAAWATAPILKRLQEIYPNPPYVVLISNNEARKVKQQHLSMTLRYKQQYRNRMSPEERRRLMGDGIIERQSAMIESLRANLGAWRERAILVGWGGGNSNFGRRRWLEQNNANFGLTIPGRLNIAPLIWDGIAAKYYIDGTVRRMADDFTLFSPKAEIMNLKLDLEFACTHNPDYYWEITSWFEDKFVDELRSKAPTALRRRFSGFIKFGMWVVRPRAVRHFSYREETLNDIRVFLDEVILAVDQVHADPVLASFWRSSNLVANPTRRHPYSYDVPPEYRNTPRWMAMDTNLDPPKPWLVDRTLPVWALARVQGLGAERRWLIFSQAPLGRQPNVEVKVPELGTVRLRATQRGCYYVVEPAGQGVQSLSVNEEYCRIRSTN